MKAALPATPSADPHPRYAGGFDLVSFAPPLPAHLVEIETLQASSYVDDFERARLWGRRLGNNL